MLSLSYLTQPVSFIVFDAGSAIPVLFCVQCSISRWSGTFIAKHRCNIDQSWVPVGRPNRQPHVTFGVAATDEVTIVLLTVALCFETELRTLLVPLTAGSSKSLCGSSTWMKKGDLCLPKNHITTKRGVQLAAAAFRSCSVSLRRMKNILATLDGIIIGRWVH